MTLIGSVWQSSFALGRRR